MPISWEEGKKLSEYPNLVMNLTMYNCTIGSLAGDNIGNVIQNFEIVKMFDPQIAEALNKLSALPESRPQAEEIAAAIVEYNNANPQMKPSVFQRVTDGVLKLSAMAEACSKLKPLAKYMYELVKPYAAANGIPLP